MAEKKLREQGKQMTYVETRGGRIEPTVEGYVLSLEHLAHTLGLVIDEAAPGQFAIQVHQPLLYNSSL